VAIEDWGITSVNGITRYLRAGERFKVSGARIRAAMPKARRLVAGRRAAATRQRREASGRIQRSLPATLMSETDNEIRLMGQGVSITIRSL
jgi:hypothetical protein